MPLQHTTPTVMPTEQLIFTLGPQELSQDDPSSLGQTFQTTVADNGQGLGLCSGLGP